MFKKVNYALSVSASGFLRTVTEKKDGIIADIQVISGGLSACEDVWIQCFVPNNRADIFIWLQNRLLEGNYVIISLDVVYEGMCEHSCSDANATYEQITVIKAALVKLIDAQVNGVSTVNIKQRHTAMIV